MTGIRPDMFYGLPGMSLPQWLVDPITDDEMAMRYPGTGGDPISSSVITSMGKTPGVDKAGMPQGSPGWAARLLGGADPLAGGIYSPDQARAASRQALLSAGLNILQNSGPSPYRRSGLEIAAGGIQAGQQAYQQGVQSVAQRLQQAREMALRERNAATQEMYAQRQYAGQRPVAVQTVDEAGNPVTKYVVPQPGDEYQRPKPAVRTPTPKGGLTAQQITSQLYDPYTVKAINTYHQFESHLAQARAGNPSAYKSAVSAFIANAEPNNQLRLGMLQYLQEVDPSVQGRADIALQKLRDGTWPDSVLNGMQQVVEHNYRQLRDRTESLYNDFLARNPDQARYVTPPSVRFGDSRPSGRTAPTGNINPITGKPRGQ